MTSEPNPYAPPSAAPMAPHGAVLDAGKLWRVVDGHLEVRNTASLPDVCVYGYSEYEGGRRASLILSTQPPWFGPLLWLPFWVVILWSNLDASYLFGARRAGLLGLMRAVLVIAFGVGVYWLLRYEDGLDIGSDNLKQLLFLCLIFFAILALRFMPGSGPSRVRTLSDSWFEVCGVPAAVVARLAEIQQRATPAHPAA
jgi:hypothetical protein